MESPNEAMYQDNESCKDDRKKDKESINGLPPCGNGILKVYGSLQQEKFIVAISPSFKKKFIKVNLAKLLHITTKEYSKHIGWCWKCSNFKDLKLTMDKYVLDFDFYALDMEDVNVVLAYPWMDLVGTISLNVWNKILKLSQMKKNITLQDISLSKLEEPKGIHDAVSTTTLEVIPIEK